MLFSADSDPKVAGKADREEVRWAQSASAADGL